MKIIKKNLFLNLFPPLKRFFSVFYFYDLLNVACKI